MSSVSSASISGHGRSWQLGITLCELRRASQDATRLFPELLRRECYVLHAITKTITDHYSMIEQASREKERRLSLQSYIDSHLTELDHGPQMQIMTDKLDFSNLPQ